MKKISGKPYYTVALFVATAFVCLSYSLSSPSKQKNEILAGSLFEILNTFHYSPEKIDDSFSEKAFSLYIKRIDFEKMYLTVSDINMLETYKLRIDDELKARTFFFYNLSVELIDKKMAMVRESYPTILGKPFDYGAEEFFETDEDKRGYAANDQELLENWRKSLKLQCLEKVNELVEDQKKAMAKSDTVKEKSFATLEQTAREKVKKRMDDRFKRIEKWRDEDRFSFYINALVGVFDPHTNYFPPQEKEDFDIQMSGKLEGIGATLSEKDGYIKVESLVPGSASWRQGQLQAEDIILKVAQGDDEPVDIVDMRLDEAVRLIRGPKGTKVVLTVKKVDGSIVKIPIVRDVVIIEDTYAKSTVLTDAKQKKRVGYLYLPKFYLDFNDSHGRKCAEDVLEEIKKLKAARVDAIIFDLRDNGGGSLNDVVKIGGFFIPSGPIVQVKSRSGNPQVMSDNDNVTYYDGPLVVMVDEFSASASEIFAAAMQDYGRAVIVGPNSTFGKGTVQRFVNLDDYLTPAYDSVKPLGQTKITIQKFYRINGGATQLKGVTPDVFLPDRYAYIELGEQEQDNPMKWDEIAPVPFTPSVHSWDIAKIKKNSLSRTSKDTSFIKIDEAAQFLKEQKEQTKFSLNFEAFKKQEDLDADKSKKFSTIGKFETGLEIVAQDTAKADNKLDSLKIKKIDNWYKGLKKDIQLFETYKIAIDLLNK